MKTLDKIRKYADNKNLMFRDFRKECIINDEEPPRYALLYPNTFNYFKKFNNQYEIEEFLKEN